MISSLAPVLTTIGSGSGGGSYPTPADIWNYGNRTLVTAGNAAIADAVWDESASAHTASGSFGEMVNGMSDDLSILITRTASLAGDMSILLQTTQDTYSTLLQTQGPGWLAGTDSLVKIRDELTSMEGAGFVSATHSLVQLVTLISAITTLVNTLQTHVTAIEGSGFSTSTDSLAQIRALSDRIFSWSRKTTGNLEHQITRGMIADLKRGKGTV